MSTGLCASSSVIKSSFQQSVHNPDILPTLAPAFCTRTVRLRMWDGSYYHLRGWNSSKFTLYQSVPWSYKCSTTFSSSQCTSCLGGSVYYSTIFWDITTLLLLTHFLRLGNMWSFVAHVLLVCSSLFWLSSTVKCNGHLHIRLWAVWQCIN